MGEPLLSVRNLQVDFIGPRGKVRALEHVSFDVRRGEVLGVVGESGSGKSTLAQALLRILPAPGVISGGSVRFEGQELLALSERELRAVRWRRISMVFQSALDALNPVLSIGAQLVDTLQAHQPQRARDARARAAQLLEQVGISADRLESYPHQLSGGMRQRVGIALALALKPALVILDEPTTALDVIVEQEILQQLLELKAQVGFSVMFITHDLSRMLQLSDRVAVFYAGRLVELATRDQLRSAPAHPYTQRLLQAFPSLHEAPSARAAIGGAPPSLSDPPSGCRFHPRCELAVTLCRSAEPPLRSLGGGQAAACHLAQHAPSPEPASLTEP